MLLRDAEHVGVEVASVSIAEIEQQERALEGWCKLATTQPLICLGQCISPICLAQTTELPPR